MCCLVDVKLIFVTIYRFYRSVLDVQPMFSFLCFWQNAFVFLENFRCRIFSFQQLCALNKPTITYNVCFDFNSLFLKDFTTKKKKQLLGGGQRSDGFVVCFLMWPSLVEADWVSETFWLKQVVVYASHVHTTW